MIWVGWPIQVLASIILKATVQKDTGGGWAAVIIEMGTRRVSRARGKIALAAVQIGSIRRGTTKVVKVRARRMSLASSNVIVATEEKGTINRGATGAIQVIAQRMVRTKGQIRILRKVNFIV